MTGTPPTRRGFSFPAPASVPVPVPGRSPYETTSANLSPWTRSKCRLFLVSRAASF
jgi:hypothetical protein